MKSFAELLTEYMERTGIGDAELARRIQVSRPTLLRWKEGVTTRPRYREDVLRCADILRLTEDETNGLLLACGYPRRPNRFRRSMGQPMRVFRTPCRSQAYPLGSP